MIKYKDLAWTVVGLLALLFGCHLLYQQIRTISLDQLADSLGAISLLHWALAVLAAVGAYAALAWYDAIAISYLRRKVSKVFIALCAFTAYAFGHNIGASVFSGALVRYRAYSAKGLAPEEIGVLIVFCSASFFLAQVFTAGLLLVFHPSLLQRISDLPTWIAVVIGLCLLSLVALYVLGSWRHFKARRWGKFRLVYPRLKVVRQQLLAGPLELACAAAIIYFALPTENNPGYWVVFGVFLASFTLALWSNAPGGLGVLEITFIKAMPELPTADVLAALIVFRCLYMLAPFALALVVAAVFEVQQWRKRRAAR